MATNIKNILLKLQTGTTNVLSASWSAYVKKQKVDSNGVPNSKGTKTKNTVDGYEYAFLYRTTNKDKKGNWIWYEGSSRKTDLTNATYTIPDNAKAVKFNIKPTSKEYSKGEKKYPYFVLKYDSSVFSVPKKSTEPDPPAQPSAPSVSVAGNTVSIKTYVAPALPNVKEATFYIINNSNNKLVKTIKGSINKNTREITVKCTLSSGNTYRAAVMITDTKYGNNSKRSQYGNAFGVACSTPGFTGLQTLSADSVKIKWGSVTGASEYTLEYTTNKEYFNNNTSQVKSVTITSGTEAILTAVGGTTYYYRLRAKGTANGTESPWTEAWKFLTGLPPAPPTVWSDKSVAMITEPVSMYIVHNASDGGGATAECIYYAFGSFPDTPIRLTQPLSDGDILTYQFDPVAYGVTDGTSLRWNATTTGVVPQESRNSETKVVKFYAEPTLEVIIDGLVNDEELRSFPLNVKAYGGPTSQTPVTLSVDIVANEGYNTLDMYGNKMSVSAGDSVYSNVFNYVGDTEPGNRRFISFSLSANDIDLEPGISYNIASKMAMSSGMIADDTKTIVCAWEDQGVNPDASLNYDDVTKTMSIIPYCIEPTEDEESDPNYIEGVTLFVYRQNYDGSFTLIADGVENDNTAVIDPHPALDFGRYRIIAQYSDTGAHTFADVAPIYIGEKSIIIQWDEEVVDYSEDDGGSEVDAINNPLISGNMIELPYNITFSETNNNDVELIEYAGRTDPVSYHGTHQRETSTASAAILKDDTDTLTLLRRLRSYKGNVYVREPSGVGYWASVKVGISQTYTSKAVDVSFDITRVVGGM